MHRTAYRYLLSAILATIFWNCGMSQSKSLDFLDSLSTIIYQVQNLKSDTVQTNIWINLVYEQSKKEKAASNYEREIAYLQLLKYLYDAIGEKSNSCSCKTYIAFAYYNIADHISSMDFATQALYEAKQLNIPRCEAQALSRIAWNYFRIRDYPNALKHMELLSPYLESGDIRYEYYYNSIGVFYRELHLHEKAKENMTLALDNILELIEKENRNELQSWRAIIISNISMVHSNQGFHQKAIDGQRQSIKIRKQIDRAQLIGSNYILMGEMFFKDGKIDSALHYLKLGLPLVRKVRHRARELLAYEYLSKSYSEIGNHAMAFKAAEMRYHLNDSLYGSRQLSDLIGLEWKRNLESKQNEIKLLEAQQILQSDNLHRQQVIKNLTIGIGAMLFAFGLWLYINLKQNSRKQKVLLQEKFNRQIIETEMTALKSQMNPHFLFNTLNSIKLFIVRNEAKKASDYLTKFSRLVRLILQYSSEKLISVEQELEILQLYILMEKLRLEDNFEVIIDIQDNLDISTHMLPPMLLQPFVENAIWHGLSTLKHRKRKLVLTFLTEGTYLICSIEDNGVGRAKAKSNQQGTLRKSLGMKITSERINLINQMFDQECALTIEDIHVDNKPSGTKVIIKIPTSLKSE